RGHICGGRCHPRRCRSPRRHWPSPSNSTLAAQLAGSSKRIATGLPPSLTRRRSAPTQARKRVSSQGTPYRGPLHRPNYKPAWSGRLRQDLISDALRGIRQVDRYFRISCNRGGRIWYRDSVSRKRPALFPRATLPGRDHHFVCARYLRYSLSYRDLEEMMVERGLTVDRITIGRWVRRYAPILNQRLRWERRRPNRSWRVDET